MLEKQIDDLIKAGRRVLDNDFDRKAFLRWRKNARECLTLLVGGDHSYTERFEYEIRKPEPISLVTGMGVLSAARLYCAQGNVFRIVRKDGETAPGANG